MEPRRAEREACRRDATNANGTTFGHDVAFKTTSVAFLLTLSEAPPHDHLRPVRGALRACAAASPGSRHGHPAERPQPTGAGGIWITDSTTVTDSSGTYSFPRVAPSSNTYYRVLVDGVNSGAVRVTVRFRVGLRVSRRYPPRGSVVRFYGRVGPAHFWHRVLIQMLGPHGHWHTIQRTRLRRARGDASFYGARVRIERTGSYRVLVGPDADHAAGTSATVRIRVRG